MKPNIVVFFTDQQRWDSTGVHGNPLDLTPNFDRFALEGTLAANAFTCQPVCAPARAALQTGRFATATGVYRNGIALSPSTPTLATYLGTAGYETAYIGKWHLAGSVAEPVPPERRGGYRFWLAADVPEFVSDAYEARLFDGAGSPVLLPGYRADAYVDAAIDYLAGTHEQPFLLFLSLVEPHHQNSRDDYQAPIGYRTRYEGRWTPADLAALGGSTFQQLGGYWGMIRRIDEAFGRFLDALTSLGLRDRTVVVFATDHGCHFKTRNSEYKRSPHDSSIRIPLAISGPGLQGGGRLQQPVMLTDIAPTLLELAQVEIPESMHGRSLLPLVRGEATGWPTEAFVQISESQVGRAIRTDRWKYAVQAPGIDGWERAGASHYSEAALYDLFADPHELHNLVETASLADVREDLRARLIGRMVEAGEPSPTITAAS